MAQSITITGLEKVNKGMRSYENRVAKVVDLEAKKLVLNIAADAQRGARVDTGFMRANIRTQVRKDTYSAISHAEYSLIVDKRFPFFTKQGLKKLSKFIPKIRSIIRGL